MTRFFSTLLEVDVLRLHRQTNKQTHTQRRTWQHDKKIPAYGRQRTSRPMRIVGPTHRLTHTQTDWRLYDQVGPEGQVGENFNKAIVTEKNMKKKL